jgi:hypothetical protein
MIMFESIFVLLGALFIKHYVVDFVLQTQEQIDTKGIYGNWVGFKHSFDHGAFTTVIFWLFGLNAETSLCLGLLDMAIHYHVDYVKMRWGTKDMYTKTFWMQFGLDQLAHAITYIELVYLAI